jgi:undecaprenyl-diphosphatase
VNQLQDSAALPPTEITEADTSGVSRSPADVLRLVVALAVVLALLFVQWLFGDTLVTFTGDLLAGLSAIPTWILDIIIVGTRLLAIVAVVGLVVFAIRGRRWRMLLTVGVAAILAVALDALFALFSPEDGLDHVELHDALGPLTSDGFPTASGVAVVSAVVTAGAPWLSRLQRRIGWTLVVGMAVCRFISADISFDSLRAALVGWLAGAAVLVLLGGPSRRPTGKAIAGGLASVGVPLAQLEQASLDARGSTPYFGVGVDGQKLFVKALGEDERSADLLFRLYRKANRRDLGDERPFSTLRRAVEHEALVALAARDIGIQTPRLAAVATAEPNGFVLAYEAIEGKSLDRLAPEDVTDEMLVEIWDLVVAQRRHRIAHRDLRLANIFVAADGRVWMIDYGFSELAASDLLLATDVAELLASSSVQVGPERAVAHAARAIDPAGLRAGLDRLQLWALGGATRTALKERPGLLDDLRRRVAAAAA